MGHGILGEITAYPNQVIHDNCVAVFDGRYEKLACKKQFQRFNVDKWYST